MDSAAAAAAAIATVRPDDEEVRRRRSTDCIYFLASPLTCKKGSECEYRHSEAARMNPRDCWYWFNGNCTNPKCSFRHPPLDNLVGAPATLDARAAQQSAPQVPVPAQAHGSSTIPSSSSGTGTSKQGVPCYYFQKGMCAKGHKCAFLHVPQSAANSAPLPMQKVFTSALQPSNPQLKNSWTKPNSTAQQSATASKIGSRDGEQALKQNLTRRVDHSSRINQKPTSNSYVQSGSVKHCQREPENGVEVGEFVEEPSAGSGVHDGSTDYHPQQSFIKGNHNSYHRPSGLRQTSGSHEAERLSDETSLSSDDKRNSQREPGMGMTAGSSDLRHRLLKQRRLGDNPRSTQAPDRHDHHHGRGGSEYAADDGLTRSRLHGRIKLSWETPFGRLGSGSEREGDRGPRARSSPPKHTDLRGKLHERLKARSNEDVPCNAKSWVKTAKSVIGEDAGSLNFAGPKSLAELKAKKVVGSSGVFVGNGINHRTSETAAGRGFSESVPFEGPKPLSVILKRKREAAFENAADSGDIQEEEEEEEEEDPAGVEGESQALENMDGDGEEDDMAYDDNLSPAAVQDAGKELEGPEEDYDYDAADINADEDNGYQEHEDDEDFEDDDDFARKVGVVIS